MALPKVYRLKRRQEFSKVHQAGIRRSTRHLTLRALRQPSQPAGGLNSADAFRKGRSPAPTRIGITVSQKVSKRAVVRNQIKRRIRAALRELLPNFATGWLIVVIVQPAAVKCKYKEILQELKQLLLEAEVFDGHSGRCVL